MRQGHISRTISLLGVAIAALVPGVGWAQTCEGHPTLAPGRARGHVQVEEASDRKTAVIGLTARIHRKVYLRGLVGLVNGGPEGLYEGWAFGGELGVPLHLLRDSTVSSCLLAGGSVDYDDGDTPFGRYAIGFAIGKEIPLGATAGVIPTAGLRVEGSYVEAFDTELDQMMGLRRSYVVASLGIGVRYRTKWGASLRLELPSDSKVLGNQIVLELSGLVL